MVLSSEAPRPRPAARSCSTSARNPKVQAAAISRRKDAGSTATSRVLTADHRRIEDDLDRHLEPIGWRKGDAFARGRDLDRLQDLQVATGRVQLNETCCIDGRDEVGGRAVADRGFGTVDLGDDVVDTQAGQRRHQMFDRGDGRAGAVADHSGQARIADRIDARRDHWPAGKVGADEDNAGVRRGRAQRQVSRQAAVYADAADADFFGQGGLELGNQARRLRRGSATATVAGRRRQPASGRDFGDTGSNRRNAVNCQAACRSAVSWRGGAGTTGFPGRPDLPQTGPGAEPRAGPIQWSAGSAPALLVVAGRRRC